MQAAMTKILPKGYANVVPLKELTNPLGTDRDGVMAWAGEHAMPETKI